MGLASKDKGVFTITVAIDSPLTNTNNEASQAPAPVLPRSENQTDNLVDSHHATFNPSQIAEAPLPQGTMHPSEISKRAAELLERDVNAVPIPEQIYANAWGAAKNQIRENYLQRRNLILEQLRDGKRLYKSTDADGTCTFKTVQKVENTRSIGSLQDKHYLRMLVKAYKKLRAYFEVNTARTGVVPGPSIVGTEGPKYKLPDGRWTNARSPNEISGLLNEYGIHNLDDPENKEIYDHLIINGLSGGITHDPRNGEKLTINDATIRYGKFVRALNDIKLPDAPDGFLSALEGVVTNSEESKPLKVIEYKSIPWVFIDNPEFKVSQFLRYVALAEKCRDEKWTDAKFFMELNASGVNLPESFYDPTNPPATELELTNKMRDGMLACLVPHAFDSDNVIRSDKKIGFYKTLAKFARSPEAQEWAEREYGIPKGTDLFTVNGKSVAHVNFDKFEDQYDRLIDLIDELKDRGSDPPNKQHVLINLVENEPQPYLEIAPFTSKADVLPEKAEVDANSYFVIPAGDSAGSDATMLAKGIVLGGAGFIVRGLMTDNDVAKHIVEHLAKPENQWHEFALTKLDNGGDQEPSFTLNSTGETKGKSEWAEIFEEKYKDRMLHCNNIHENNAFNAAIFSEFFEGDENFKMDFSEESGWAKDVQDNNCLRSLATPRSEAAAKARKGQQFEQNILQKMPFLKSIPIIKDVFDPYKAGKTFDTFLKVVSRALMIAAPIEIVADKMGAESVAWAGRFAQRLAYGANTIASGVSRGLFLSSHKFYWQFIGELFGLASAFFPQTSTFGQTLKAINQTVLIGRANELAMRTNYNLDGFKDKAAVKEEYSTNSKAKEYFDKRGVAAKVTQKLMKDIDWWTENFAGGILGTLPMGKAAVATVKQFTQAAGMALDFITVPQLRANTLKNFFSWGMQGPTKMSKNSGKPYGEVHEENTYAFAGMATLGTALASTILGKVTGSKLIDTALTNLANMIPALGIVTAGKLVHQDQAGDPRVFTDVSKRQINYSPERSGMLQMISGWAMAVCGAFMHTKTGAVLYNALGNGLYFEGIREQLKVGIDDSAVNKLTRQGDYYRTRTPGGQSVGQVESMVWKEQNPQHLRSSADIHQAS